MPTPPAQRQVFTVAHLNAEVRQVLEQGFGSIWLVGEVSNFAAPASGHWYLTLKDERAQIRAAMFRNANQRSRIRPQNGSQVLVRAKLTVYEPRGDYQLIIEHMEDAGAGLLQQQYEQLKQQLQQQGLFAQEHKQALPSHISKVGVITSPTGAAIRDILAVLKRRDPSIEVIIYPSQVQGQTAAGELRTALQQAINRAEVDVLVLTRGGGSLEDLWCFNDEQLAHDIFNCPLPIISAVGHEIDFTIADFVADLRAPTPSAAAELVSQDQQVKLRQINQLSDRLTRSWSQYLTQQRQTLGHLSQRLRQQDPKRRLQQNQQRLDELQLRIHASMQRLLKTQLQRQQMLVERTSRCHPERQLKPAQRALEQLDARLQHTIQHQLHRAQQRFQANAQNLNLVSPLAVLGRGYAIALTDQQEVIRRPEQLAPEQAFTLKLADGELRAKRIDIKHDNEH